MEESVWIYFGVILVIVSLGIIINVYRTSQDEGLANSLFQSVENLGGQAALVCKSPRDTMLSLKIDVPAGAVIRTTPSKICGVYANATRCVPAACDMAEGTVLDLTQAGKDRLFASRQFTCAFLKGDSVSITCQG